MSSEHSILKIMLCGPITGNLQKDQPIFEQYQQQLRQQGIETISPLEAIRKLWLTRNDLRDKPEIVTISKNKWNWLVSLEFCLGSLIFCDAILIVPGWNTTIFGLVIFLVAQKLGLQLLRFDEESGKLFRIPAIEINYYDQDQESTSILFRQDDDRSSFSPESENTESVRQPISDAEERLANWFRRQIGLE